MLLSAVVKPGLETEFNLNRPSRIWTISVTWVYLNGGRAEGQPHFVPNPLPLYKPLERLEKFPLISVGKEDINRAMLQRLLYYWPQIATAAIWNCVRHLFPENEPYHLIHIHLAHNHFWKSVTSNLIPIFKHMRNFPEINMGDIQREICSNTETVISDFDK